MFQLITSLIKFVLKLVRIVFYVSLTLTCIGLIVALLPNFPPHSKIETPYKVTSPWKLEGTLALNNLLSGAKLWHQNNLHGPEQFASYDGKLYTSVYGDVVRISEKTLQPIVSFGTPGGKFFEEAQRGRPLGLTFDSQGSLYVADAYFGIFKVNIDTGNKVQLVSANDVIDGKVCKLFNSVSLDKNGNVYWSCSSSEFYLFDGVYDMLADGSGRLLKYDAKTKKSVVLLDKLRFANGVIVSEDESYVLVVETTMHRVHKHHLKGKKAGTSELFLDGLPGIPDNLQHDGKGGYFVPLVLAHDADHPSLAAILAEFPLARRAIARLLTLIELPFQMLDTHYPCDCFKTIVHTIGHFSSASALAPSRVTVLHVNGDGRVQRALHATDGSIKGISEAFIYGDELLLGSPFNTYIARIPLKQIGMEEYARSAHKKTTTTTAPPTTTTTTATKPTTTKTTTPTTTTPKPTTTTPTTTTPKPTTTTPKPTTTTTTTTTPKPTTTTTKPTTPKPTTTTTKPTTTTTTTTPKPTTTTTPKLTTPQPTTQTPPTAKPASASQVPPPKQTPPPSKQAPPPTAQTPPPKQQQQQKQKNEL